MATETNIQVALTVPAAEVLRAAKVLKKVVAKRSSLPVLDPPMSAHSTIEATSTAEGLAEVERLADTLGFDCAGSATVVAGRKFNGFDAATRRLHFKGRELHPYYVRNPR